ncbi:uncharacterized protein L969DRAFT_199954 [Mixia osmundae IAM 14324]|uniref:DNA2/NAM7 helicase-like C-terminal domain-containing protein n=1 Tax=Mixia osmundae (strain CBS 9802 / IAM 14324 / JCM 22182 / KY 12970) TaxID=764103 RepID=G7DUX4_MIXOS|nr:uncharacterized protein L969DRAFT_199954 [Mixia osmundae IAM 14324]KEI37399.1 hypothetical protein L969DRAFT_199954 [Mixia osmundae IAM 14324]GAA94384.1 hypothetical protein E5Q_01035 [Mixia osmundae IAM 14324]
MSELTATKLAQYQQLNCDLFLHKSYHAPRTSRKEPDAYKQAVFDRGHRFEAEIVAYLRSEDRILDVNSLKPRDALDAIVRDPRDDFFVVGFAARSNLSTHFEQHDTPPVRFGTFKPDFVHITKIEAAIHWHLIDAKMSHQVKPSHFVQLYFYHLSMLDLLRNRADETWIPSEDMSVWLPSHGVDGNPARTPIRLVAKRLDKMFFGDIPQMLGRAEREVDYHLNPLCKACDFEPSCRDRVNAEGRLGKIPGLSHADRHTFLSLSRHEGSCSVDATEIEELDSLLHSPSRMAERSTAAPEASSRLRKALAVNSDGQSNMLEAAKMSKVMATGRRSGVLSTAEDVAVIFSLVPDPNALDSDIVAFAAATYVSDTAVVSQEHRKLLSMPQSGDAASFVRIAARVLRRVIAAGLTAQVYVSQPFERSLLSSLVVRNALDDRVETDDLRMLIGCLCEGAAALATQFQPIIIRDALEVLTNKGALQKTALVACAARLDLPSDGSVDEVRERIAANLQTRFQGKGNAEVDGLKVVALLHEIPRVLAIPVPGYLHTQAVLAALSPPDARDLADDEQLYAQLERGGLESIACSLSQRTLACLQILQAARTKLPILTGRPLEHTLLRSSSIMKPIFCDVCHHPALRKLSFVTQFETLSRLDKLVTGRIDDTSSIASLIFLGSFKSDGNVWLQRFRVVQGALDPPAEANGFPLYDYLLVKASNHVDLAVTGFPDLALSNARVPLTYGAAASWRSMSDEVRESVHFASIESVDDTLVCLRTWSDPWKQPEKGSEYQVHLRLTDFSFRNILTRLMIIDISSTQSLHPFVSLVSDADAFAAEPSFGGSADELAREAQMSSLFTALKGLRPDIARVAFQPTQRRAFRRMLTNRLSVVFGPPGSGKTSTIALSLLRLCDIVRSTNSKSCSTIFMTAMTHAAIDQFQARVEDLKALMKDMPGLDTDFIDNLVLERVRSGTTHPKPQSPAGSTACYLATVWQLAKLSDRFKLEADLIIVDEASQLSLTALAMVTQLSQHGKLLLAGDPRQLGPIITGTYPPQDAYLYGSSLDCVLYRHQDSESQSSFGMGVTQLEENFRLNPDLASFVSTIYTRRFVSMKRRAHDQVARRLQLHLDRLARSPTRVLFSNIACAMQGLPSTLTKPFRTAPISAELHASLINIDLSQASARSPAGCAESEAQWIARIAHILLDAVDDATVFVACPHRKQRQAVRQAFAQASQASQNLSDLVGSLTLEETRASRIKIETIERLQGAEATFVIAYFASTNADSLSATELEFFYVRERLNVALSRAKELCILLTCDAVLMPPLQAISSVASREGFAYLDEYVQRSHRARVQL